MLDFAASKVSLPHGARAVEYVNSLGIGNGAVAIEEKILTEGMIIAEGGTNDI